MRAAGANDFSAELPDCFRAFDAELDFVHRMLRRSGASATDADDLAQEVFLVVWRRWRDYDPQRPLRPWLAGITFRVVHDHFRRTRREVPSGFVDGEDQLSPLDQLASARARALVLRALAALPERQRAIMILHELVGMPIAELGEALLVPVSTLYSRLKKAHQTFAKQVRRLQRQAPMLARRMPDVEALLETERTPRPEPPERRRRVMARIRALMAAPRPPVAPLPRASRRGPLLVAAALLLALAGGLAVLRARPPVRRTAALVLPRAHARPAPSLAQGLVGYWRFDDAAGAVARDASGNRTDCAMREMEPRAAWTDGPLGGALSFGGLGWLACNQPRFTATGSDLSVSLWVKRTQPQPGYHALVTRQTGTSNLDHFFVGFRGDLILLVSHVWGGKFVYPAPPVGRWFHLAMVHGHGEVVLFLDGVPVARRPSTEDVPSEGGTAITVAGGVNGPDPQVARQRFVGAIDELAIYQRMLSDDEVKALAEGARPAP